LNYNGITYLPIGERPFEKYTLTFQNGNDILREFWPAEIKGIDPEGTLFEKDSGKKLSYDADVEIDKEYYLLTRRYMYVKSYDNIRIQKLVQKRFGLEAWTLYEVSASTFNEDAARFYLDFHCRLTDCPVSLRPVWPLFVEGNYFVKHNQSRMFVLVEGNVAAIRTFPTATVHRLNQNESQPKLYEVRCSNRQQLISVGRTQTLQYTYFWKELLDKVGSHPQISVTDLSGVEVAPGETDTLPRNKTLCFQSSFDGELVISYHGRVADRRKMSADQYIELDGLSYGFSVQAVIGLDVIWEVDFKKPQSVSANDEIDMLKQITHVSGATIPIPHSLRNILAGMSQYPQICQWIQKRIKIGTINEQSYRRLQKAYRYMNMHRKRDAL
jgi:hypothetical protein